MKSQPLKENRSGGQIVVLDVDSNLASRRARQRFLTAADYCVHEATGVSQAMETAAAQKPDVVLLGSGLPDLDAAEICRRLKAGPNVPLVVLLIPTPKAGAELPSCGADLCLPKSLAPGFVIEALRTLLRMRAAERELASTADNLEAARKELERSRAELVNSSMQLAHDIEGPLRGVVTFAELIGQAHPLSDSERTYLKHVLTSADQVRRLTRCLLTYAQAKRDRPRLAEVQLRSIVAAAMHALREQIKETAAVVQVQDPLPSVLGDFSALQVVMQSLVGNAIHYRCPNSAVSIRISAKEGPGGELLVSVADNGIGVAKEHHEIIFAPFKRLHGLEIPGAGMGLAICRQIVEGHGGRIWVESEAGHGAEFLFTLPPSQSMAAQVTAV
jgi:two-component system sensor histidine kinase/response regulator